LTVSQSIDIPQGVLEIVAQHHEREGGSGYPRGLPANQLHAYARMAAIVDCYGEFVEVRPGFPPVSAFQAFNELKELSRDGLNAMLVEQFAHCVGMFPVGSLVELNTGEVAIVLSHGRTQRFLPSVMIILDVKKQPYDTPLTLNLRSADPAPSGVPYSIAYDLPHEAYGVDTKQYYL
jgi:HD-GYP domain-containing protein (c-di-GMP phosphodiesterase class II)